MRCHHQGSDSDSEYGEISSRNPLRGSEEHGLDGSGESGSESKHFEPGGRTRKQKGLESMGDMITRVKAFITVRLIEQHNSGGRSF